MTTALTILWIFATPIAPFVAAQEADTAVADGDAASGELEDIYAELDEQG